MTKGEKKGKKRDYFAFFIVSFILIFLTSSFVIEDIYNSVDDIKISPVGVQAIYEASIGAVPKDQNAEKQEDQQKTVNNEPTQENKDTAVNTENQKTE